LVLTSGLAKGNPTTTTALRKSPGKSTPSAKLADATPNKTPPSSLDFLKSFKKSFFS